VAGGVLKHGQLLDFVDDSKPIGCVDQDGGGILDLTADPP
jgi:hypothetical protein